jgi:hypothetical protein
MSKPTEKMVVCCPHCGGDGVYIERTIKETRGFEVSVSDGKIREKSPHDLDCAESVIWCGECNREDIKESELIAKTVTEFIDQD